MATNLRTLVAVGAVAMSTAAAGKPIAFQDGWTVMGEYGTNTMRQAQVFHAPTFWYSAGLSYTKLMADDKSFERDIPGVQLNYLVKRWNMPNAQANVFAWGNLGVASGHDERGKFAGVFTPSAGAQADYETRSIYASAKQEWFHSSRFSHGVSTVQLGGAPYEHDYDELATWFVVQLRRYQGGIAS